MTTADGADAEAHPLGSRLLDTVAVMTRLRGPDGCAWVAAQDHASLAEYVTEEAEEVREALEAVAQHPAEVHRRSDLADELGDLLFQVIFHAAVASEDPEHPFDIDDVADALTDKLVRRNPHVFGDSPARTIAEIQDQWEAIKAEEKASARRSRPSDPADESTDS